MISNPKIFLISCMLWLAHFCVDAMIGFWPVYKTMAGLDLAYAGIIVAGCALCGESMQILFGSLCDKGHKTALVSLGLFLATASTFLAYTQNYFVLFLLFLTTCVGSSAFHPAAVSFMGGLSEKSKGFYITFFASGGAFGMAFSQLIFTNTFYFFEGRTVFAAIPILLLAGVFFVLRSKYPLSKTAESQTFEFKKLLGFFGRRDLRLLYFSQVCNQAILWGSIFLLPDVLRAREYDDWISLGAGNLALVLGSAFMMVPAGYLADRYSTRAVLTAVTWIGMVLFYCFISMPLLSDISLLILLFAVGAALGVVNPVAIAFGNKLVPENPGLVSAFLMGLVWCVSEGIGQAGGGVLTKLFTEDAPAKALGCLGVCFFVAQGLIRQFPLESEIIPVKVAQEI